MTLWKDKAKEDLTPEYLNTLNVTVINWMRIFKKLGFKVEQRKWYRVHETVLIETRDGKKRLGEELDGRFYLSYNDALTIKEKYDAVKMGPPRGKRK